MRFRRRLISGAVLLLIPAAAVLGLKQTSWGPILDTPQARQFGDPGARVVLIEYSDFQCPSCAHIQPTVHALLDTYKGRVRLMFKYFPLTRIHQNALAAAHAAQCAAVQNQFWPYADQLFTTQDQWKDLADPATSYMAIGAQAHLDMNRFGACYADDSQMAAIQKDIAEGTRRGVNATPTFFVGDTRLVGGVLASDGARVIERKLRD